MLFTVSKTYEVWNDEAYEAGETDDRGWEYQDEQMTLSEVINEIKNNGITSPSSYPVTSHNIRHTWLSSVDAEEDYKTGDKTYYSLFLDNISDRNKARIFKLVGIDIKP